MWSAPFAEIWIWLLPAVAFASSIAGSAHCLSMCGPLVSTLAPKRREWWLYQSGRLSAYLLLGAFAGATASVVRELFSRSGISAAAWGALFLLGGWAVAAKLRRLSTRFRAPPRWMPLLAGALHLFLPCGWLYAFVALSATAGTPVRGALVMFGFWAGALPALAAGPLLISRLRRSRLSPRARQAGLAAIWVLCLALTASRLVGTPTPVASEAPHCH